MQRILSTIFCITYLRICRGNLPRQFTAGICRGYLPWEFAVGICRENLPRICRGYLPWVFVYASKSFFIYVSKSCLYGSKPFLYARKTLFVRFFLLTQFPFLLLSWQWWPTVYNKIFKTQYCFHKFLFKNVRTKSQSTRHLCKKWLYKCYKVYENKMETQIRKGTQETQNDGKGKTNFPKE